MSENKLVPKKSDDLSKWYLAMMDMADLVDYGPVGGSIVIKPYAYSIWEQVQTTFNEWFKADGVQNAYFPLLIPKSYLEKEKEHVEGFSPELAVVTVGGGEELAEPLVVRPTSETIMYTMFADWISSYKDLPLKINQWTNIVRWEKRTYPFLRTSEFLWQEGHTVHATEKEALEMVIRALEWYKKFYEEYFAISVYAGEKSGTERFAGAQRTFSIEMVMPDGKALQGATSHLLGQNFSKAFDIKYSDEKNILQHPYQTSWGFSTRALGALFMVHGDDKGLILPPKVAPYQAVIVPVETKNPDSNARVQAYARTIGDMLAKDSIRFMIDNNLDKSLGYRLSDLEIKGIPLRILIGEKELDSNSVTLSRRDTGDKEQTRISKLGEYVQDILDDIQAGLLEKSKKMKEDMTVDVENFEQFKEIMEKDRKFIRAYWDESQISEKKIKELTKATTRVVEDSHVMDNDDGTCVYTGNKARRKWLFAQAY